MTILPIKEGEMGERNGAHTAFYSHHFLFSNLMNSCVFPLMLSCVVRSWKRGHFYKWFRFSCHGGCPKLWKFPLQVILIPQSRWRRFNRFGCSDESEWLTFGRVSAGVIMRTDVSRLTLAKTIPPQRWWNKKGGTSC